MSKQSKQSRGWEFAGVRRVRADHSWSAVEVHDVEYYDTPQSWASGKARITLTEYHVIVNMIEVEVVFGFMFNQAGVWSYTVIENIVDGEAKLVKSGKKQLGGDMEAEAAARAALVLEVLAKWGPYLAKAVVGVMQKATGQKER